MIWFYYLLGNFKKCLSSYRNYKIVLCISKREILIGFLLLFIFFNLLLFSIHGQNFLNEILFDIREIVIGVSILVVTIFYNIYKRFLEVHNIRKYVIEFYEEASEHPEDTLVIQALTESYLDSLSIVKESVKFSSLPAIEKAKLRVALKRESNKVKGFDTGSIIDFDFDFWEFLVETKYLTQKEFNNILKTYESNKQ